MFYEHTLFWGNNYRLQSFIRLLAFRFNNILKSFKFGPLVLWAADPIFHPQCQFFCTDESKWQNQDLQNCWKSYQSQHLKKRNAWQERATADSFRGVGGSSAVTQTGRWINTSTAAFEKHQRLWQELVNSTWGFYSVKHLFTEQRAKNHMSATFQQEFLQTYQRPPLGSLSWTFVFFFHSWRQISIYISQDTWKLKYAHGE